MSHPSAIREIGLVKAWSVIILASRPPLMEWNGANLEFSTTPSFLLNPDSNAVKVSKQVGAHELEIRNKIS